MSQESLKDLLKRLAQKDGAGEVDWDARKRAWLASLDDLYSRLEGWLKESKEDGVVQIERDKVGITEEYLGSYNAPTLRILLNARSVLLRPVGTLIVGAHGRVDVSAGSRHCLLIRNSSNSWSVATHEKGAITGELNESTFAAMLRDLLV